ncbi:MAG TPA: hypothetical protein VFU07_00280 [Candidatus Lumbricidophila sp.]|nr:hypothetical protein [Candidatus Lumbricidophila sp.]
MASHPTDEREGEGTVGTILRLKLHLMANIFRRNVWQAVGLGLGLLYGLGVAAAACIVLVFLRTVDAPAQLRDVLTVVGAIVVVGFAVVSLLFGVDDTLDPRKFALFGIPNRRLSISLAVAALLGAPGVALVFVMSSTVVTWSRGPGEIVIAIICALCAIATCVLVSRLAAGIAGLLLATRRARELTGVLAVLLFVVLSPGAAFFATLDWRHATWEVLSDLAAIVGWTPVGAAFAAPGDAASGNWGLATARCLIALATVALLWFGWERLVARMLVTPQREAASRNYRGVGWFDRTTNGPTGAIAARSLSYWLRDARYWMSLVMIPVVPVLVVIPLLLAGLGAQWLALVPVPFLAVFMGWSMHNDTAYDSTAIWLHIASGVRGVADRVGRVIPMLVAGVIVIGIGASVTGLVLNDWRAIPGLIGVSAAALFGSLGIGCYLSAQFPYPVSKPGDSPFQQPQSTGALMALVQVGVMLGTGIVALPAGVFLLLGVTTGVTSWHLIGLAAGTVGGLAVLAAGIWLGGRVFERRGPEILQAAIRA